MKLKYGNWFLPHHKHITRFRNTFQNSQKNATYINTAKKAPKSNSNSKFQSNTFSWETICKKLNIIHNEIAIYNSSRTSKWNLLPMQTSNTYTNDI